MLGIVQAEVPGWLDVAERILWILPWLLFLVGVLLYPWPKGVRIHLLITGVAMIFLRQVYDLLVCLGVFGPPRYTYEEEIPRWLEVLDVVAWVGLGMGGMVLATLGAWLLSRGLAAVWGEESGRERRRAVMDGFITMGGMLESILALLTAAAICLLMFVLHRRSECAWSRIALIAGLATLVAEGFCSAMMMYYGMGRIGDYALPWNLDYLLMTWSSVARLEGLMALVMASAFLGLAISQRRSKSRVARRRKT